MKAVMISIRPKWCELIAKGEKTMLVKKTRPNVEMPFKCYIYATKSQQDEIGNVVSYSFRSGIKFDVGKVVCEFTCDKIEILEYLTQISNIVSQKGHTEIVGCINVDPFYNGKIATIQSTLLSSKELIDYGKGKPLYAWHISDLKIYNEPKKLSEFVVEGECNEEEQCWGCKYFHSGRGWLDGSYCDEDNCEIESGYKPLIRPPQSWQYCEELEEKYNGKSN